MSSRTVVFVFVSACVLTWALLAAIVLWSGWEALPNELDALLELPASTWELVGLLAVLLLLAGMGIVGAAALHRATRAEQPGPRVELPRQLTISYASCRDCGYTYKVVDGILEEHPRPVRGTRRPEKCPGAGRRVA